MEESSAPDFDLERHLRPAPESEDESYLAWRDRKVRAALVEAHLPETRLVSHDAMRKLFGL